MQDLKLKNNYTFWFSANQEQNQDNFVEQIKKIGTFGTAKNFWSFYSYIVRPDKMPEGSQFFLFSEGIQPAWEDPHNFNGGRFILRVRHGWENRIWEELLLQYIGDDQQCLQSVCGIIAHAKKNFTLFSIWVKDLENDQETYDQLQKWIIKTVGLKNKVQLEFIAHPKK